MYGPARLFVAVIVLILAGNHASAQNTAQTAPEPVVSAQNDAWYLNGDPVTFAGNVYYLAGPQVYFNRYEMIRSGAHFGVPLYTRTTIEPYSVVFVPIGGGLMQPYERRRAGDVAGTVGSTTPSFPVVSPSEQGTATTALAGPLPQAPAPPTLMGAEAPAAAAPVPQVATAVPSAPQPVATSGRAAVPRPAGRMRTAERPRGLNGVYVEFERVRWFNSGAPIERERATLEQIGEYQAFPVYARRGDRRTIYIPAHKDSALLTPYSRR